MKPQQQISHYVVLRKLGQGGMGEIYLAEDTLLGRSVALKCLSPAQQADPDARARFVGEARAAAAIDHPYICKVYEAAEIDGTAFIAMEFVEGVSLAKRLEAGALPLSEALRIAAEIAEALAKAHERGIVHRDLKPSNVMLTGDGHVKVVDFGLARQLPAPEDETVGRRTKPGVVMGTLTYMSPEQVCGRLVDFRTDIFCLGLIVYEMLTGRHPFERPSSLETAMAIVNEFPAPLASASQPFSAALQAAVARMLSKDPAARYQSTRELAIELQTLPVRPAASSGSVRVAVASLAVLPLVNRTGSDEDEYFSDGMTEEIIIRLSKVGGLRVISLGTAMRFKKSEKMPADIGRELGVETVLEGSVRRAGPRVRISAGLTDVASQTQLWAEGYDRDATDIFAIQADVADQIAQALKARFPSLEPGSAARIASPANLEVYHLYLKGWHAAMRMTPESFQHGWRYFQKALDLDPTYARSYAGMAITYARAGNYGYLPPPEAFSQAKAAARKALEFDPDLPEAHVAMALVALYYEWDWPAAEQGFLRALKLNPNFADAHLFYSVCLVTAGRPDQALAEARRALQLDPLSAPASVNLAYVMCFARRTEEALEQVQKTLYLDPDYLPAKAMLAVVYWYLGRYDEGNRILEQWSWTRAHLAWGYAMAGKRDEARAILRELLDANYRGTFDLAILCLLLGELDGGIQWLEKALDERDNKLYGLKAVMELNPFLRPYCSEPRVQAILARIGPSTPATAGGPVATGGSQTQG